MKRKKRKKNSYIKVLYEEVDGQEIDIEIEITPNFFFNNTIIL